MSTDKIRLDIDIINIQFKYLDTNTVSDIEYSNSDADRLNSSKRIQSRIRSENICTVFILAIRDTTASSPSYEPQIMFHSCQIS